MGEKKFAYPVDFHLLYGFLGSKSPPNKAHDVGKLGANSKMPLGFSIQHSALPLTCCFHLTATVWILASSPEKWVL